MTKTIEEARKHQTYKGVPIIGITDTIHFPGYSLQSPRDSYIFDTILFEISTGYRNYEIIKY